MNRDHSSYADEEASMVSHMNLSPEDKAYFDSLVREEMEKLEREFQRSAVHDNNDQYDLEGPLSGPSGQRYYAGLYN